MKQSTVRPIAIRSHKFARVLKPGLVVTDQTSTERAYWLATSRNWNRTFARRES